MSASEWCVICKTPVSALLCQRCAPAFGIVERIIASLKAEASREALALAEPLLDFIKREVWRDGFDDCECKGKKVCLPCQAVGVINDYHRTLAKESKP